MWFQQQHKGKGPFRDFMKPIQQIESILVRRIDFLHELFLISSYHQLISISTSTLNDKHQKLQKQETGLVSNVLSRIRIDEVFKKQFHALVIRTFIKIQPRTSLRTVATGTYRDIMHDYTSFFTELKEKNIVDFLRQIFQLQIYTQTTIIYVLLELLFKYLRIKCSSFISDRIEPQVAAKSPLNRFSYVMLNENAKKHDGKAKQGQRRRNVTSPMSHTNQKVHSSLDKESEIIQLKSKTISFAGHEEKESRPGTRMLRSAEGKRTIIHSPRDTSTPVKRRVIKSYKDIREETKEKIQRNYQNFSRGWPTNSSQAYYRIFIKVYEKEWTDYLELVGVDDKEEDMENAKASEIAFSEKKKKEWLLRNSDRVVVEACSRNDEIRRQMENYTEQYCGKFRK